MKNKNTNCLKIIAWVTAIFCIWAVDVFAQENGLWSGEISVDKVSEVRNSPNTPTVTASEFNMNIFIHQDAAGQARLIKDVTIMRKKTAGGDYKIVLLTDDTLIPNYEGVVKRNGEMIGIRMGSVFYDFPERTLNMTGTVGKGQTVSASIQCAADFPSNPYRHKYHPAHREGVALSREIVLEIFETPADTDAAGNPKQAGYGEEWLEGNFTETVTGLHKIPIHAGGTFTLQKISQVSTLNE